MNLNRIIILILFLTGGWVSITGQNSLFETYNRENGLPAFQINDLVEFNGKIWIASANGVYVFKDKKTYGAFDNPHPEMQHILHLYADKENLWMISADGRLFKVNKSNRWSEISLPEYLSMEFANKIINDFFVENGKIYVSTVIGGHLYQFDQASVNYLDKSWPQEIQDQATFYVYRSDKGNILAGSRTTPKKQSLLYILNKKGFFLKLNEDPVYAKSRVLITSSGQVWYGKNRELIVFKDSVVNARLFLDYSVECIFEDSENKIWIGLQNGGAICFPLAIADLNASVQYLGNKTVSTIFEDKSGNIYFGTVENGMYVLPAFKAVVNTDNNHKVAGQNVNEKNAIPLDQVKKTGIFNHQDWGKADPVVSMLFTSVRIDNADTVVSGEYLLEYPVEKIDLEWAMLIDNQPVLGQYKIYVSAKDTQWVYTSQNRWSLIKPSPGNYRIKIYGLIPNGTWTEKPLELKITIPEPIWMKKEFWVSSVLSILLIATAWLYIVWQNRKKRKMIAMMRQKQLLESEITALRSQMNPHFLFNTLASIQNYIENHQTGKASEYLNQFARLMRQVLEYSKKSWITVGEEMEWLKNYIELEKMRMDNKFDYEIVWNGNRDFLKNCYIPSMILQPFVENAIRHGLSLLQGKKGLLKITIRQAGENSVEICVEDNGVGREVANMKKENKNHRSVAMNNIKERIDRMNIILDADISFDIVDLFEGDQPAGTLIKLIIPQIDDI